MTERKTILVTGATGAQGGGVARHLLAGGKFAVRCLTRDPNSEKASAFKNAGAELVKGNFEDVESLHAAIKGCYGAFGVTNYWEHFEKEYAQGKNLVEAVAAANVEHFVFSTLPYVKKLTNGKLAVPHFDIKGQLEEYARGRGLAATFVHVAFYFENFLSFFPPRKQDGGTFSFGFPQGDTPLAGVAVEDVGGVVAAIFDRRADFRGKTVGIVGDDLPPQTYAEIMTRVLGKKVVYNYIPREVFSSFAFPGAEDLANMFEFNRLHIPNRQADLTQSRALYLRMQ
ncbi:MAG: NmrA/HSCARG family protein, partial [Terriglobia bacterium]